MPENTCVISYKTGHIGGSNFTYGDCFDTLQSCCDTFRIMFFQTGNQKSDDWNRSALHTAQLNGLNLLIRGDELHLYFGEKPISFCPWCGARITIQHSQDVTLRKKTKVVPDGLEEVK